MFLRGLEIQHLSKIGGQNFKSFNIFGKIGSYIINNMVHFMWNLLIVNFKAVFHKIKNLVVRTFYFRNNLSDL